MQNMKTFNIFFILVALFPCLSVSATSKAGNGIAYINGAKLYYEISGRGQPLLYLHGGLSSSRDFDLYRPVLNKEFAIITIDRRGHGRSTDTPEPYSYAAMAEDIAAFMEQKGLNSAFVVGWSDGGIVGFHLASKYPARVRKLVAVGANYLVSGTAPEALAWVRTKLTPDRISSELPGLEEKYRKQNPQPDNFPNFINKSRAMWLDDPYISREDFQKISAPVLLVAGDRDDIRLEHMLEMHALLKNSQLCILPNGSHFMFNQKNEAFLAILRQFLR